MTTGSAASPLDTARGRPLGFRRDALVDALVRSFWELGWNGASYPMLEQRTGVARSSMANTIGSKSDLLIAALERYLQIVDERLIGPLREGTAGLGDIRGFYERLREGKRTEPGRWGCLMAIAMIELGTDEPEAVRLTREYRRLLTDAFGAALSRAEADGELAPGSADVLPPALTSAAIGLNVSTRAAATDAELDAVVAGIDHLLELLQLSA